MLVIPSVKVFTEGGRLRGDSTYGFDKTDGRIPLPQNTEAYIIAFAEDSSKILFGIKRFITSASQDLTVEMSEKTKYEVDKALSSLELNSVNFEVKKTENADKIKENEEQLETLGEKLRYCNCGNKDNYDTAKSVRALIPSPRK